MLIDPDNFCQALSCYACAVLRKHRWRHCGWILCLSFSLTFCSDGAEPPKEPDLSSIERVCHAASQELARRGIILTDTSHGIGQGFDEYFSGSKARASDNGKHVHRIDNPALADLESIAQASHHSSPCEQLAIDQAHAACFEGVQFPPASKCQPCHPDHYREWSVSPHAYAQMSPVFNAMSSRLNQLTNGTLGDFCIRCHTPVAMARGKPIVMSSLDRAPEEREGVTCVVCHRVNQNWGKISGRQALVGGDLGKPIYGPTGSKVLREVLRNPERFGVLSSHCPPEIKGREIHTRSNRFFALTTPAMCGTCHDVFLPNGFRLEDAFSEFKASPAAKKKHQDCQACHMGVVPGVASGYTCQPAAKVGNAFTKPRRRTNHMMIGPDYSILHPGIFPHNPKLVREECPLPGESPAGLATMRQWLLFDYRGGWGTHEFERYVDSSYPFPECWRDQGKRFRARDLLDQQMALLAEAGDARHQLLATGYRLGPIQCEGVDREGLHLKVCVSNGTDGHSVPTGFDAERLVFLRVAVFDRYGKLIFVSGDLDPNGDVRDRHSRYVHNHQLPLDQQLFSLQSRFLTRNIRGGEREQILNVAYSLDPLPFLRPETRPFTVLGRPIAARKHKQNIEVGGKRWARYTIARSQLTGHPPYRATVQLVAAMVPVNLIHEISPVGFDYGMSARQVARAVVDGHVIVHSRSAQLLSGGQ